MKTHPCGPSNTKSADRQKIKGDMTDRGSVAETEKTLGYPERRPNTWLSALVLAFSLGNGSLS